MSQPSIIEDLIHYNLKSLRSLIHVELDGHSAFRNAVMRCLERRVQYDPMADNITVIDLMWSLHNEIERYEWSRVALLANAIIKTVDRNWDAQTTESWVKDQLQVHLSIMPAVTQKKVCIVHPQSLIRMQLGIRR